MVLEDDTESVYHSCLEEQDAYEKYLEFLRTNFPELYAKHEFMTNEIYENGLIWGLPMSGKSDASIAFPWSSGKECGSVWSPTGHSRS